MLNISNKHTGVYNAGFENDSIINIAKKIQSKTQAKIKIIKKFNDPRSYRLDSSKLKKIGFKPKKKYIDAVLELKKLYLNKKLKDKPIFHSVSWLKKIKKN